jgi:hypothetical protein
MRATLRTVAVLLAGMFAPMLASSDVAAQRGGQHLNSLDQRALAESRKPKAAPLEPATVRKRQPQRVRVQ